MALATAAALHIVDNEVLDRSSAAIALPVSERRGGGPLDAAAALWNNEDRAMMRHATRAPGLAGRKRRGVGRIAGTDDDFEALAAVASDTETSSSAGSGEGSAPCDEQHQQREVVVSERRTVRVRNGRRSRRAPSHSHGAAGAPPPASAAADAAGMAEMEAELDGGGGDAAAAAAGVQNMLPAEVPALAPEWGSLLAEFGPPPDERGCLSCDYEPTAPQSNAEEMARIGGYFDSQLEQGCGSLVPVVYHMSQMHTRQVRARAIRTYVSNAVDAQLRTLDLVPPLDLNFVDVNERCEIVLRAEHPLLRELESQDATVQRVREIIVDTFEESLQRIPAWPANYILWHYVLHRPNFARTMLLLRRGALQTTMNAYIFGAHTRSADGQGVVPSQDGWKSLGASLGTLRSLYDSRTDKQLAGGTSGDGGSAAQRQLQAMINAPTRPLHVRAAPRFVSGASSSSSSSGTATRKPR